MQHRTVIKQVRSRSLHLNRSKVKSQIFITRWRTKGETVLWGSLGGDNHCQPSKSGRASRMWCYLNWVLKEKQGFSRWKRRKLFSTPPPKKNSKRKGKKVGRQEVSVWNAHWPISLNYWEWERELWECVNCEKPQLPGLPTSSQVLYTRIT